MRSLSFTRLTTFLCIGFFSLSAMANACDMAAVNSCIVILSRNTGGDVITDGISAIPTVQKLKQLCGALDEFNTCYKPKAAECTRDLVFSMTFGTIENTMEYLCVEGHKDIVQYADCWNRTDVITASTKCHVAQNDMIETLHRQQTAGKVDSAGMRSFWCEILENTTSCMRSGVEPKCGEVPGCIIQTTMSRALKGLAELMKCAAPEPCQLPGGNATQNHSDQHTGHTTVHSDGTPHSHGDIHHDHANDGQADAETVDGPGNAAYTVTFRNYSYLLIFAVIYFCNFRKFSK